MMLFTYNCFLFIVLIFTLYMENININIKYFILLHFKNTIL